MGYGKISFQKRKSIIIFSNILNTFLRNIHSNFPLIKKTENNKIITNDTGWVTPYFKNLCSLETDFYLLTKNYNDIKIMHHYEYICKTLSHTIKETKRSYYNTNITSENAIKTTWNTVKSITIRRTVNEELKTLKIDGKCIKDCQIISNFLNDYFISTAIMVNDGKFNINHPMEYLYQTFKKPFRSKGKKKR